MKLATLADINLIAQVRLGVVSSNLVGVRCYGSIKLGLGKSARVRLGSLPSAIGIPLLAQMTNRRAVTTMVINGELVLNGALIGRGVAVNIHDGATFSIGSDSYVADGSMLSSTRSISIGPRCAISWGVTIIDDDGHGTGQRAAPIEIGEHVWIGCNAMILKGVAIGDGSIVGAGAVVAKSCPPRSLVVGNPARVVRTDVTW